MGMHYAELSAHIAKEAKKWSIKIYYKLYRKNSCRKLRRLHGYLYTKVY